MMRTPRITWEGGVVMIKERMRFKDTPSWKKKKKKTFGNEMSECECNGDQGYWGNASPNSGIGGVLIIQPTNTWRNRAVYPIHKRARGRIWNEETSSSGPWGILRSAMVNFFHDGCAFYSIDCLLAFLYSSNTIVKGYGITHTTTVIVISWPRLALSRWK